MRILVVEDELTLASQLRTALAEAGYVVDVAVDGQDGHFLGAEENREGIAGAFRAYWRFMPEPQPGPMP